MSKGSVSIITDFTVGTGFRASMKRGSMQSSADASSVKSRLDEKAKHRLDRLR